MVFGNHFHHILLKMMTNCSWVHQEGLFPEVFCHQVWCSLKVQFKERVENGNQRRFKKGKQLLENWMSKKNDFWKELVLQLLENGGSRAFITPSEKILLYFVNRQHKWKVRSQKLKKLQSRPMQSAELLLQLTDFHTSKLRAIGIRKYLAEWWYSVLYNASSKDNLCYW